ncbi:hypothetical protein BaRGS_00023039 [Batillaria attramentaria]|uniref:Uncharacterized protein n=1 Tax=Batillaria attramentaria TaxID=370345 RepID=A0ABD0KEV1_9CAEN
MTSGAGNIWLYIGLTSSCVIADSVAPKPTLSLQLTTDLTFACDMADFRRKPDMVISISLLLTFDCEEQEDRLLAIVDSAKAARASPYLENSLRMYKVEGSIQSHRELKSWLKVTLADVGPRDFGAYKCHITYIDRPADTKHSLWLSDVIHFVPRANWLQEATGFEMRQENGLDMRCGYASNNSRGIDRLSFETGIGDILAEWSRKHPGFCSSDVRLAALQSVDTYTTMLAHVFGITCADDRQQFTCSVGATDVWSVTSLPHTLAVGGCDGTTRMDTTPSTGTVDEDGEDPDCCCCIWPFFVGIAAGIVLCISAFILYKTKGQRVAEIFARSKKATETEGTSQPLQGSSNG